MAVALWFEDNFTENETIRISADVSCLLSIDFLGIRMLILFLSSKMKLVDPYKAYTYLYISYILFNGDCQYQQLNCLNVLHLIHSQ